MSEDSKTIIVSTLVDSIIQAENNNKTGINDTYIMMCRQALKELKEMNL